MAQPPLLVDEIRIEPGSGDILRIYRESTGALTFSDAIVTGGISLQHLAGLGSVNNIITVGKSGAGAQYTTISDALASIPASAGPTNAYLVLVGPGIYRETVNIVRDWVTLVGLGSVVVTSANELTPNVGADNTIIVHADLGTIPKHTVIQNLTITNSHDSYACIRIAGGAGSEVGVDGIRILDCFLEATGAGYPICATESNDIYVQGGSCLGSSGTSLVLVQECSRFVMNTVDEVTAVQMDYDTTGNLPITAGSEYRLSNCNKVGVGSALAPPIASDLSGAGSFTLQGVAGGDVTISGDQTFYSVGSALGNLVLNGTTAAFLIGSSRNNVTGATATLTEPTTTGIITVAGTSASVAFDVDQADDQYTVALELTASPGSSTHWVSNKSASGFDINFSGAVAMDVGWATLRSIS